MYLLPVRPRLKHIFVFYKYKKTDNINRILIIIPKQIILLLFLAMWPGLCKTDNINQMITLSVITLSGFHCSYKTLQFI